MVYAVKQDRHSLFSRIKTLTELERFLLDEISGKSTIDEISGKSTMTKSVDLIVVSLGFYATTRLQGPQRQDQNYKCHGE
jgi:hypothetical protein